MVSTDSQSLECDLLETYGIINMYELPMYRVALFSYGLGDNSRIKKKISNQKADIDTLILALIFDRLGQISAGKDSDKLISLYDILCGIEKENDVESVEGVDEWEEERARRIEKMRRKEI